MGTVFKTVAQLSVLGGALTALLLALKPVTVKKLPAKWQSCMWLAVIVCMLFPAWKLIPQKQAVSFVPRAGQTQINLAQTQLPPEVVLKEDTPVEYREITVSKTHKIRLLDLMGGIWLIGMGVYLLFAACSYASFLIKTRRHSQPLPESEAFIRAKAAAGVRQTVRLRMVNRAQSPFLTGMFRPVIYLPCTALRDDQRYMVFLHELMHLKRKDLARKWLALLTNAIHWFNPLAYLLCANLSEACEVACDMAVTAHMPKDGQNLYMKTILDLVTHKNGGEKHVSIPLHNQHEQQ